MEDARNSVNDTKLPKVLCVIPAKGNSRRLPKKNIKVLAGKPLLVWTLEAAQKAKLLTDYLVSSDDPEIIEVAKEYVHRFPSSDPRNLPPIKFETLHTLSPPTSMSYFGSGA